MPIVRDIPLTPQMNEILRRTGIKADSKLKSEMETLIGQLLVSVNDEHLLEPAIVYEIYPITEVDYQQLSLEGNTVLHGSALSSVLSPAKELAVLVCTIGCNLEEKVTDYFGKSEPLRGLLLDGIGSAAVGSVAREGCELMTREASLRGYQTSSPLSPGGPSFPLSEQWQLFKLVPAEEIGVRLTSTGFMLPRKSTSMVIGIGPQMTTWTRAEACARCNLSKTCPYRIRT